MSFAKMDNAKRVKAEASLAKLMERVDPKLRDGLPQLMEAYAQIYAREFSTTELHELSTFAESPTGRHYLAQSLMLQSDPELVAAHESFMGRLTPVMEEFAKEECSAKAAARVAAGNKHAKCPLS